MKLWGRQNKVRLENGRQNGDVHYKNSGVKTDEAYI